MMNRRTFHRQLLCPSLLLGLGSSLRAAEKSGREAFEDAIDHGLDYLSRIQTPEGAWSMRNGRDPAITSLCVMAFMSSGHVPGEGRYGLNVDKGIRYVMSQQHRNGMICSPNMGNLEMYEHGICTLMLAEAVGMLPDRDRARALREKLELAVKVILNAQVTQDEDRGGWRYTMRSTDSDISVSGWQLMALRAARNVGCDIPAEPIDKAIGYIKRCHEATSGGYRYQRYGSVTVPCTGTSVLALELTGKDHHRSPEALKAGSYLLKNPLNPRQQHFFYGIYYTAQAMFQLGDNYWTVYRKNLHELLLRQLPPKAAGCWVGWGGDDAAVGPNYCTAMAILALTVEYRFLPIYQRNEEPVEAKPKG
ncbi:MAG: terpene cyclase/mutase family protein [Planctomycetes bacterium]|nr:terpene cyclase/mutase family protein [Planctomycetota bacterium]